MCGGLIISSKNTVSEWSLSHDSILTIISHSNSKTVNRLFSKKFKILKISDKKMSLKIIKPIN